jgi:muramoyltetrapeptide carboxypeptidase
MSIIKFNSSSRVIGIIAPSSPVPKDLVENSITYFENQGFIVKCGNNLKESELFSAGTDEQRAADIMTFFKDSDVAALWAKQSV